MNWHPMGNARPGLALLVLIVEFAPAATGDAQVVRQTARNPESDGQ